ncbi:hypothetical protein B0E53_06837 [Micromonospora sp. MH33]|nr:hypothetical protein B0E53_06837 [Micromonospora sp. MH33]
MRSPPAALSSNARYVTPGCCAATSSGSRTSVLPISTNRPPRGSSRSDASTNSPARASSTTSTPAPPLAVRNASSNSVVRDDAIRSSATPSFRRVSHLPGLAVAYTVAPR